MTSIASARAGELAPNVVTEIERSVSHYNTMRSDFATFAMQVEQDFMSNAALAKLVHSTRFREKDPEHLRDKLIRKALEALDASKPFSITAKNLTKELDDLSGVRLLHIHREQLREIHPKIIEIAKYRKYKLREKPVAYTWDSENSSFYKNIGLKVETKKKSMYTSVHYILQAHFDASFACELQVRTLAEELWGEVSHTVNYPHSTRSIACTQQLSVLARVTWGCTRLVDSIFASQIEHDDWARRLSERPGDQALGTANSPISSATSLTSSAPERPPDATS